MGVSPRQSPNSSSPSNRSDITAETRRNPFNNIINNNHNQKNLQVLEPHGVQPPQIPGVFVDNINQASTNIPNYFPYITSSGGISAVITPHLPFNYQKGQQPPHVIIGTGPNPRNDVNVMPPPTGNIYGPNNNYNLQTPKAFALQQSERQFQSNETQQLQKSYYLLNKPNNDQDTDLILPSVYNSGVSKDDRAAAMSGSITTSQNKDKAVNIGNNNVQHDGLSIANIAANKYFKHDTGGTSIENRHYYNNYNGNNSNLPNKTTGTTIILEPLTSNTNPQDVSRINGSQITWQHPVMDQTGLSTNHSKEESFQQQQHPKQAPSQDILLLSTIAEESGFKDSNAWSTGKLANQSATTNHISAIKDPWYAGRLIPQCYEKIIRHNGNQAIEKISTQPSISILQVTSNNPYFHDRGNAYEPGKMITSSSTLVTNLDHVEDDHRQKFQHVSKENKKRIQSEHIFSRQHKQLQRHQVQQNLDMDEEEPKQILYTFMSPAYATEQNTKIGIGTDHTIIPTHVSDQTVDDSTNSHLFFLQHTRREREQLRSVFRHKSAGGNQYKSGYLVAPHPSRLRPTSLCDDNGCLVTPNNNNEKRNFDVQHILDFNDVTLQDKLKHWPQPHIDMYVRGQGTADQVCSVQENLPSFFRMSDTLDSNKGKYCDRFTIGRGFYQKRVRSGCDKFRPYYPDMSVYF